MNDIAERIKLLKTAKQVVTWMIALAVACILLCVVIVVGTAGIVFELESAYIVISVESITMAVVTMILFIVRNKIIEEIETIENKMEGRTVNEQI